MDKPDPSPSGASAANAPEGQDLSDDEMRAWGSYWSCLLRMPPLGLADAAHRLFLEVDRRRRASVPLVKHMVSRFLAWRLPDNFRPDDGISFTPINNVGTAYQTKHTPSGTNLFDAAQAEAMVRYMLDGQPPSAQPVSPMAVMAQALRDKAAAESAAAPRQPEGPPMREALEAIAQDLHVKLWALASTWDLAQKAPSGVGSRCANELRQALEDHKRFLAQPKSEPEGQDLSEAEFAWYEGELKQFAEDQSNMPPSATRALRAQLAIMAEVRRHRARPQAHAQPAPADAAPLDALRRQVVATQALLPKIYPIVKHSCDAGMFGALNELELSTAALASAEGASAAPRDERPDAIQQAVEDERKRWRDAVQKDRDAWEGNNRGMKTADWEALRAPLEKLMADAAAAPLGAPDARPDDVRLAAEEVFKMAMVMFENLPEGSHEEGPYSSLALAVVALRKALDAAAPASGPSPDVRLVAALAIADRYYALAPKHAHMVPGIWDMDNVENGVRAGKPCQHCADLATDGERLIALASSAGPSPDALRDEALVARIARLEGALRAIGENGDANGGWCRDVANAAIRSGGR